MKLKFQTKTNLIFFSLFLTGASFLIALVLAGLGLLPHLKNLFNSLAHKISMSCGCLEHLTWSNHPYIFSGLVMGSLFILGVLTFLFFKSAQLLLNTRKFVKDNLRLRRPLSSKLKKVVVGLNLNGYVLEINEKEPLVFCFGFWNPKICVSRGLVSGLDNEELNAVILHEATHLKTREPFKTLVVKIFAGSFFFIPGFAALAKKYFAFAELAADESATYDFTKKEFLARALYKIIKLKERLILKNKLALSFFGEITEERVNRLSDDAYSPQISLSVVWALAAVLSVVSLLFYAKAALGTNGFSSMESTAIQCSMPEKTIEKKAAPACSWPVYSQNFCASAPRSLTDFSSPR